MSSRMIEFRFALLPLNVAAAAYQCFRTSATRGRRQDRLCSSTRARASQKKSNEIESNR